jgi:hypothetical protein
MENETLNNLPDGDYIVTHKDALKTPHLVRLYTKTDPMECKNLAFRAAEKKLFATEDVANADAMADSFESALLDATIQVIPVRGVGYGEWDGGRFVPLEELDIDEIFPVVITPKAYDQHGRLM